MRPVIDATLPLGYRVHIMWFRSVTLLIKISPSIILNYVRHVSDHNFNFDILLPICSVVGTSTTIMYVCVIAI